MSMSLQEISSLQGLSGFAEENPGVSMAITMATSPLTLGIAGLVFASATGRKKMVWGGSGALVGTGLMFLWWKLGVFGLPQA